MSTLLISLGTSWAVVPEAWLFPGADFAAVHVLTTASVAKTNVEAVVGWFRDHASDHASGVEVTVTRVDGFGEFRSEADHFRFEEVLYRWYLENRGDSPPHVCLAGGFKTMSAAMQKAAAVLGAAEVFHVLCDLPAGDQPDTPERIAAARADGRLHWIRLGPESGWPQFAGTSPDDYPLDTLRRDGAVRWVQAANEAFRARLQEIVERSHRIAGAWDRLPDLPFQVLATWPAADLRWLDEPVDPVRDAAWIDALPKVELHCHLGGFATRGALLQEVRSSAENPLSAHPIPGNPAGWPRPQEPVALEEYMKLGDVTGSTLLWDSGCLRKQCQLLYRHLLDQNVAHAEIRCSPANYADPSNGRSPWQVLDEIRETFQECMVAAAFQGAEPVATSFQDVRALEHERPASGTLAGPDQPSRRLAATFIPFDKDAGYHQTWRNLPHRYQPGATAFVTFRLADSLPAGRLKQWRREQEEFLGRNPKPWDQRTWETYRRRFPDRLEDWLDEAHGQCVLRDPVAAGIVESALRFFDGDRYVLDTYAIMPNHVHVLVKPLGDHRLDDILHSWKSYTAEEINKHLSRRGKCWEHESFDHLVRHGEQLQRLRKYIAQNPTKAGLTEGFVTGRGLGLILPSDQEASRRHASTTSAPWKAAATASAPWKAAATPGVTGRFCHVNLILIATRREKGDYRAAIARHLALAVSAAEHWMRAEECRVVGVDLAGFENRTTRAHYFREEFTGVHRCGLALTVHAGENDDAEGIWRAVFDLNARRLGHALHLVDSPELMASVAARGIGVEMCPFANYQIHGFHPMPPGREGTSRPAYPLRTYLDAGIKVTINTDNIGISGASLAENLRLAAEMCPDLTRLDLLRILSNAIDTAFLAPAERAALRSRVETLLPPAGAGWSAPPGSSDT